MYHCSMYHYSILVILFCFVAVVKEEEIVVAPTNEGDL